MTQTSILDVKPSKLDESFWNFHYTNRHVLDKLINMSDELKDSGNSRISMKMLFEVIRFRHLVSTKGDLFLLNNSYTSRYVRLIEETRPDLAKLFEKRSLHS